VLEHYGIRQEEMIAFGDGENDMEMLQFAGIGIAMGNAEKEVKAVADYVTDDIDDDGIWKACRHFGLI
jgi:hydroxymethylpyrimidine pyrophosphatase-like HAD family hydrolase